MLAGAGDQPALTLPPARARKPPPMAPSWARSGPCLARFKVAPMVSLGGGGDRPYMGACCPRCTPHSKKAHLVPEVTQLGIRNLLHVSTLDPDRAFLVRTFCYLSHTASRQIHLPPQPVNSQVVLESDSVQLAIERTADLQLEAHQLRSSPQAEAAVRRTLLARADALLAAMRSSISTAMLRLSTWALFHLLGRTLGSVQVHKGQLEVLRRAQQASPGTPLVFLPLHKSHLDYVLLSFACTNHGISAPLVAAGDNLRIPLIGWLLSRLGAFFVQRRLDSAGRRDLLYRAVLQSYMTEALRSGHNIEFFIEGGRSRNGRPRPPKGGLLSVVVAAYESGQLEDALIVPVGISYDRLMDGNFISEQLGRPKQKETLGSALAAVWAVLRARFGAVRLDLAQPFKLSEFLASVQSPSSALAGSVPRSGARLSSSPESQHSSSGSLHAIGTVDPESRHAVHALAQHVIYDAARCCAVMSTQMVALLLLHRFRQGCTQAALCNALGRAREDLKRTGIDVGFSGADTDVVQYAVDLLGPGLVTRERMELGGSDGGAGTFVTFLRPVTILPNVLELAYYANMAVHAVSLDAVLVTALLSLVSADLAAVVDTGPRSDLQLSRLQLLSAAAELADLCRDQLLLTPPCRSLDEALSEPLSRLTAAEILVTVQPRLADEDEEWASRAYGRLKAEERWDSDEEEHQTDTPRPEEDTFWMLQLTRDTREHLLYLQSLVAPLVDTYYTTACCLQRLVATELAEPDFVVDVLYEIKNKLMRGMLAYGESLSAESIRSALRTFQRWRVLETHRQDDLQLIYLTPEFDSEEAVADLAASIVTFRK